MDYVINVVDHIWHLRKIWIGEERKGEKKVIASGQEKSKFCLMCIYQIIMWDVFLTVSQTTQVWKTTPGCRGKHSADMPGAGGEHDFA